jgi:type III pantothenate kinase
MSTIKGQTSDEYAMMLMDMFFYSGYDAKQVTNIAVASVTTKRQTILDCK